MKYPKRHEQINLLPYMGKWLLLATLVAILSGTASALFLFALDWATDTRNANRWLIWLLPIPGFLVGLVYLRFGQQVEGGNNLIIDEIHDPKRVIPLRMAPLVLGATVLSHLFGASVGREGTAVQMGGALADQLTHVFKFKHEDRRILLMAGISAGFASVFGTPLAGAIFGLEVLAIGRLHYDAILACTVAAVIADQVSLLWGVHHTHYVVPHLSAFSLWMLVVAMLSGTLFGLTGRAFADATHALSAGFRKYVPYAPLRPLIGGLVISAVVWFAGADRYIGLGIPVIAESFRQALPPYEFAAKMLSTIASLGSGFKGGEVTPLFYIGATLGNALAQLFEVPIPLLAGIGFVAVFAGAANTPIASTLMAMELFGAEIGVYAGVACVISYLFSGHSGIYRSQRVRISRRASPGDTIRLSEVPAYRKTNEGERKERSGES